MKKSTRLFLLPSILLFAGLALWAVDEYSSIISEISFSASRVQSNKLTEEEKKFYGVLYVLQRISPLANEDTIAIPPAVLRDDIAANLCAHNDQNFVLRFIAATLEDAQVQQQFPEAAYYAALAWWELGDFAKTAANLEQYTQNGAYRRTAYALLTESNFQLRLFGASVKNVHNWEQLAPGCDAQRLLLSWGSLLNMGLYEESKQVAVAANSCGLWQAPALLAKTLIGMGKRNEAEAIIEQSLQKNPETAAQLRTFWLRLSSTELYTLHE